ncbi:MAG: right-handed parallel beta-helix repeat-containing protein [Methanobacteriota archaeon]|nr:MAG: right-handed parallel beta-helix repeat-containing protein [Euryarchaeota archaeon]
MSEEVDVECETVIRRPFRRIAFMAIFGLIALAALMLISSEPAEAYTVVGVEVWTTPTLWNQDVIVAPGGDLTILNTDVWMDPGFDGQWEFRVQNQGTLRVVGSQISSRNFPITYNFYLDQGSIVSFTDSKVAYAGHFGPTSSMGLHISTDSIVMDRTTVEYSGSNGIYWDSPLSTLVLNGCYIANNSGHGIYVADSVATDYWLRIIGGSTIYNNNGAGVYFGSMGNKNIDLDVVDSVIARNQREGVNVEWVNVGNVGIDAFGSDISGNAGSNIYVDSVNNGILNIFTSNTHLDGSQFGSGIYVNTVGAGGSGGLIALLDQSFVLSNAMDGIYVNQVIAGDMAVGMLNSVIERNGFLVGGNGVTLPMPAQGFKLDFGALGSSFSNNANDGILFSGAQAGSLTIYLDTCNFFTNGGNGVFIGYVDTGSLVLYAVGNTFNANGGAAIYQTGSNFSPITITIDRNDFNTSNEAIRFTGALETIGGSGHNFSFIFTNNWLDSDWGEYGVRFDSWIQNFGETNITIDGNHFWGRDARDYGVYFASWIGGDWTYWSNLTIEISWNEFVELDQAGVSFGHIYWFRFADIDIIGNIFTDSDGDYEYGVDFFHIYSDHSLDSHLSLDIWGNQVYGLTQRGFDLDVYMIRHVMVDYSNNYYDGRGMTISGLAFNQLWYGSTAEFSEFIFNAENNLYTYMQTGDGIYFNTGWSTFFRYANISITSNFFNLGGDAPGLGYGLRIENDIFYSYDDGNGSFNLYLNNNEFVALQNHGVRIQGSIYGYADLLLMYTNNLFENQNNIWMEFGVHHDSAIYFGNSDIPSSFTTIIQGNDFYDLNNDGVKFYGNIYEFRDVSLIIEKNNFVNRVTNHMRYGVFFNNGIHYGTDSYDSHYYVSIRENTIRDLDAHGIHWSAGDATYGFRHVDIQIHENVIENVLSPTYTGYGIYWYYEMFYGTNWFGSSFNLDVTGNHFRDLADDAIALKNFYAYDFMYFSNVSVNIQDNNFLNTMGNNMDYGLYLRTFYFLNTNFDNSIDIVIINNTFDSLNGYGVYFYSGTGRDFDGYRNAQVTITDNRFLNTVGNWMPYGVYLQGFKYGDDSYDNTLTFTLTDNTFSDMTAYGVHVNGQVRDYRNVDIYILDNIFTDWYDNFDRGVYFDSSFYGQQMNDGMLRLFILRNQFFDLNNYGISFGGYFYDYRNVSIAVRDNWFLNTIINYMDYGVYMYGVQYGDDSYDNYFDLDIANNRFENLTASGFRIGSIFNYRSVILDVFDNYASDIYNNFDQAIYFNGEIYHSTAYPGEFYFTCIGNTFKDMANRAIYFSNDVRDFRNYQVTINNNDFLNTIGNWMDDGLYFQGLFYDSYDYESYFQMDITFNNFENLSHSGIRIQNRVNSRHVTINLLDNIFSDMYNGFDYGVYLPGSFFHSSDYDADIIFNCQRNTFQDLRYRGIYISGTIYNFRRTIITVNDNNFINIGSDLMDEGIYFSSIYYDRYDIEAYFYFNITNNNFENLTYAGVRLSGEIRNFRHMYVNILNNYFSDIYGNNDYGVRTESDIYMNTADVDSELFINIVSNEVRNLYSQGRGMSFSGIYNYRSVTILVDNNDIVNTQSGRTRYGLYFDGFYYDDESYGTYFNLDITNNNFENLTDTGFELDSVGNYRYLTVDIYNNYFGDVYSGTDYGVDIGELYIDSPDYYSEAYLTMTYNEFRDFYYWGTGAYFSGFGNYYLTVVTIDHNDFISTSSGTLGNGAYFDYFYFDEGMYDCYLFFNATFNVMENLNSEGFTLYTITGIRHVYVSFLDNTFTDVFNSFNYGIYTGEDTFEYTTDYDSYLEIVIARNTFYDLSNRGVYIDGGIYDFRNVWITIDNNDFINTIENWMDYGFYMQEVYYGNSLHDTYFYLDITNNNFENLTNYGFRMSYIGYYRYVSIDIINNYFSDIYNNFNYGIYFSGDIYHTRSLPGTFDLWVSNNYFYDLTSYAVRFQEIGDFGIANMLVEDNDFSRSYYGLYISGGIDYVGVWDFEFGRNYADDMDYYMLYLSGTSYGYAGDMASIWIHNNTMTNSGAGFYVGSIYYYDLSGMILIENNALMDMRFPEEDGEDGAIGLDWFYRDENAHLLIRDNTITGDTWAAIYFSGAEDMAFVFDILYNDIDGVQHAIYMEEPVYGDNMYSVGTFNIMQNDIRNILGYGIYTGQVYYGLMDLNVDNNVIIGDPLAYYGVSFYYLDYADWNSMLNIDFTNNIFENGFYGFYLYESWRAIINLNLDTNYVTNTYYTFYFYYAIDSGSDVLNVNIRKSIFTDSQLAFFFINEAGNGLFVVDITDCEVLNYGSLGGYGFVSADNNGGYIRIDVYSTRFVGSPSRLGDAFAGYGQVLMNFWYIDGITSGISNSWNQRIQVLWDVDVSVYVGQNFTQPAGPGIVVYVNDQFGYQSFYTTTGTGGTITGQTVAGVLITYSGTPYSGQAVHTFYARQGSYTGSAVGSFSANGTITIFLPGDNDGDGLHDGIDIDDDNDGVPDVFDDFPFDDTESKDTDNDGIGDNADIDDDNDGVPDMYDDFPENPNEWRDTDGDGIGDNTDLDIDGDGIINMFDTTPYNNTGIQDSDGDGVVDSLDDFPYNPSEWGDNDGDGIGDNADEDDDNDGLPDAFDLYPFDASRTDPRAETAVDVDIAEAADFITPVAVIIIGVIILLMLWLLLGRKRKGEEEVLAPKPLSFTEEESVEEPEKLEELEELDVEEKEAKEDLDEIAY